VTQMSDIEVFEKPSVISVTLSACHQVHRPVLLSVSVSHVSHSAVLQYNLLYSLINEPHSLNVTRAVF